MMMLCCFPTGIVFGLCPLRINDQNEPSPDDQIYWDDPPALAAVDDQTTSDMDNNSMSASGCCREQVRGTMV